MTPSLEGWCSIQLSYGQILYLTAKQILVGVERFELPTSCSQSRRATRLRYTPRARNNNTAPQPVTLRSSFHLIALCDHSLDWQYR